MRVIFGVLSLLIGVAAIGVLAKRQMGALSGLGAVSATPAAAALPVTTPQQQSEHFQHQVKRSIKEAMQQVRPEPDDDK